MKRKILHNFIGVLAIISFMGVIGCNRAPRNKVQSAGEKTSTEAEAVIPSKITKPTINVYVENSGSMDGYVKGVTEFEQAVYNYLSNIKISGITDTLNMFYINSRIIPQSSDIADFIEKLEPSSFKQKGGNRGVSDISNVFKTIFSETRENDVAILVTDGIFSPGKGIDAEQYLVNQQIGIKNVVAEYLTRFPKTAVVVYQLSSKFNGTYYNRNDAKTEVDAQRPFYIWIIGDILNIAKLKRYVPENSFKGSGIQHSYTLLPSFSEEINFAILNTPKLGTFARDKKSPKTSIYDIKVADSGTHKGEFMFTTGMDLTIFKLLLGGEYLLNTGSYARLIDKQPNNDYLIEMELNTTPSTNYTHNMKLTTTKIVTGELEIILRNEMPQWVYDMNDDEGLDINRNDAINKTFGIKYLVEGICEAYKLRGNTIYTSMKLNLKK